MEMKKLPDAEFEIMKAVWQVDLPATSAKLMEQLGNERAWKLQTLHTLLNRLTDRGFLRTEKLGKERRYYPLVSKSDYLDHETKQFVRQYHEGSVLNLVNTAYNGESLSEKDIDELVKWANEQRNKA